MEKFSQIENVQGASRTSWADVQEDREADLLHVLYVLRRHLQMIIGVTAFGVLVAILFCLFMKPRYEGMADLNVHPEESAALDMGALGDLATGAGGLDWSSKLETQARILKSDTLAWDVISQLRLDQNEAFATKSLFGRSLQTPVGKDVSSVDEARKSKLLTRFSKALRVEAVPKTQVIEIRFRSTDPALAAKVVNTLTSSYMHHNFMTRFEATMQASAWLQQRLTELKNNVEESQRKLAEYQSKANIIGTDETDNLAVSDLTDVSKQLTDAESDRIMKEAKYRLAQTGNPELIGTILPDSVLPVLRSQEADLRNQLAQYSTKFGSNYPKVIQLNNQLAQTDASLKKEIRDIEERFRTEYESAKRTEDQLRASVENRKKEAFSQSAKFSQYDILKNEVASGRSLYEDLLRKLNEAGIAAGLKSTNVDVIDPSAVPQLPVLPNVPLFIALGLFGGAFLGVCSAFVKESIDQTISSPEDAEEMAGISTIGLIPHFSMEGLNALATENQSVLARVPLAADRPQSKLAEAFRALRTSLLLANAGAPPKVIMITSAQPGDGKSTVSVNISAVLAQSGARVLLVDADLRRGVLARNLKVMPEGGLSECLAGRKSWRDLIIPVNGVANMWVLPAGHRPPSPADLFTSNKMEEILNEWRGAFDHVVIDTPPVVAVTDGVVLSQKTDAVLLIARASRTGRHPLRHARMLLAKVRANVVGLVVNDFDAKAKYYGYSYSYDKYYVEDKTETTVNN
ncbi:Protein-tyrosine kinase [Candidatus Koribacter versatilis Ellin345]|uniref:non-specific protein-tyrosine kinase n=1 Tax=Koribacter versatilis (strain Ellin345) TaxID=204669 RepID=Q1ITG0_KORVE|nr:polysaccharide biosynthesis tyrosine autokinase [Candidatus Koribacter versatilis]ABF39840.1 Protein-tyrosine kinase [Candidatus Koribacter versatilis Ellin345]